MKTIAQQTEIPIPAEPFALIAETAQDGERIAREAAEEQARRERADKAQIQLF